MSANETKVTTKEYFDYQGFGGKLLFGVLLAANLPEIVRWIEQAFGVSFLSADVYYISEVPSQLEWSDVSWITLTAFLFSATLAVFLERLRAASPGASRA